MIDLQRWTHLTGLKSPTVHTFQRAVLQQLLAKHLDAGDKLHFSKRLSSFSESTPTDSVTLNFKDGSTATCDLVIGSDGIRSAVRHTMYNELADEAETRGESEGAARLRAMVEPVFSGQIAYRGLAPTSALPEDVLERARTAQIVRFLNPINVRSLLTPGLQTRCWARMRCVDCYMRCRMSTDDVSCSIWRSTLSLGES